MKLEDLNVTKLASNATFRLLAVLLIILIVMPEASLAVDLFATLDILGAELFLFAFFLGLRGIPWGIDRSAMAGLVQSFRFGSAYVFGAPHYYSRLVLAAATCGWVLIEALRVPPHVS